MKFSADENLIEQLNQVIKDGIDYMSSSLQLFQARVAEYTLSGLVFTALLILSCLLVIAGFIVFNVAVGIWLTTSIGKMWGLIVLGSFYILLASLLANYAFRWLNKLKS